MDNEDEIGKILAQADVICESTEMLGAVRPSTHDTTVGTEGMAPLEGGNGEVRMGGDSYHGSPPSLSRATEKNLSRSKSEVRRIVYRPIPLWITKTRLTES